MRAILVCFLLLFTCFSSKVYAASINVGYYGTTSGGVMWADSSNYDDTHNSISLEGRGVGSIDYYKVTGVVGGSIPVELDGSSDTYSFPSGVIGFKLKATSGKFWGVLGRTSNPVSDPVYYSRPSDWESYIGSSTSVSKVDYNLDFSYDEDAVLLSFRNWDASADSYKLKFTDQSGDHTSDSYTDITGKHVLTCNGMYWLNFFDSSGQLVSDSDAIEVSGLENPACDSYQPVEDIPSDDEENLACACCDEVKSMIADLDSAVASQGLKLDELQNVTSNLVDAVENQGLKLDAIEQAVENLQGTMDEVSTKLDGVNDRLDDANSNLEDIDDNIDRTNDKLDQVNGQLQQIDGGIQEINNSLKPTKNFEFPVKDWESLIDQNKNQMLESIPKVEDTNTYFSDPGQGEKVPAMPAQPDENYPFPIGESFQKELPITAQPPISRQLPTTSQPPMQREPVGSVTPMKRDPVPSIDRFSRDAVRERTNFYDKK